MPVFVACRDHQQAKTNDVGEAVRDLIRRTRVFDAGGQAIGDAKALFDLAQNQNAAIRRQQTAIEFGDNCVLPETGDRPGSGRIGSSMAGVASRKWRGLASTTKSYAKSAACATSANLR